ncbi:hypothetical protein BST81_00895 [Leptolyngbya sp. 'hensonii']|uniref:hypothetical protein n=1 Tax=Leptolyngbya sp. 'hensonii' TaxID=1922337 RepID=UPI00094FCF1C|nr:hypothetical protein [Leptolyngbya sp. 'hensonii']OLP20325.1 hypothetical protein BST81_00895 [Leptolyngbya sp. 'hensonii']
MDDILDTVLGQCDLKKLAAIGQDLLQLHANYQALKLQAEQAKSETTWMGRLNPFSQNETVKEFRQVNQEMSQLEQQYDGLIGAIKREVTLGAEAVFPLQFKWLMDELWENIDKLRVSGKGHLVGKEDVKNAASSLSHLVNQHFGHRYASCPSQAEFLTLATRKICLLNQLPLQLYR